jgi:hypothetical protein
VEKTFLHEVSESDEEEYEIVAKKASQGHFILFHFLIFSIFCLCGGLNNFSAD